MKQYKNNDKVSKVEETEPFIKTFSSQEEGELYNLKKDIEKSDMEKFQMFCRMMRIGKMLSSDKIIN